MLAGKTVFHLCPRAAPSLDACRLPRHRVSRAPPQPGKPRYPAGTAPRGRSGSALQSAAASCLCPLRAWHPALAPALSCRRYSHRQIHCTTRMRLLIIHGMFNGGILSQHGRAHPSPHILSHLHILCICLCQSPAVHYVLRGNPRKSGAPCGNSGSCTPIDWRQSMVSPSGARTSGAPHLQPGSAQTLSGARWKRQRLMPLQGVPAAATTP